MHVHVDISIHMYMQIYIYIYIYTYVFMYNMHMLDKIIIHVSRNVHNLISETLIYMTLDAEHNETTPTIPFHLCHEDIQITNISKAHETIHIV